MKKHLVYAEDLLWELMQYPDTEINKAIITGIVNSFAVEQEVTIASLRRHLADLEDEGDIYD